MKSTLLVQNAPGCLGAMPSRDGMTAIGSRMAIEQYVAGGKAVVFDVGTSNDIPEDLTSHHLIMASPRTGMSQPLQHLELVAQATSFGVLGGRLWNEPKTGVRKPISMDRKAKARKAAKAAAKSRRRNRQ